MSGDPTPKQGVSGFLGPQRGSELPAHVVPANRRRQLILEQGGWVADDQAAFALRLIAGCAPRPVRVLHPLHVQGLLDSADEQGMAEVIRPLHEGESVATLVLSGNHWIGACWTVTKEGILAWSTAAQQGEASITISALDSLIAKALTCSIRNFAFHSSPIRPPVQGLCGHFALADLMYHVLGRQPPSLDSALQAASLLSAAFELSLQGDRLVPGPAMIGGGPTLLEAGIAATLREHGVPAAIAMDRAVQAIQAIGKGGAQKALEGPQPWKELKAMANASKFQLVMPSEMQAVAEAKGPPKRRQRKGEAAAQKPGVTKEPPKILPPAPDAVRIPEGVFSKDDGTPLRQISSNDIGPQAEGVVLASWLEAKPYLELEAPVSKAALALVVLGEDLPVLESARVARIRFQAVSLVSNEPILLGAVMIQIGDTWAAKSPPKTLAPLDLVPSGVVRVAAYRDQVSVPWDAFTQAPMRNIVSMVEALQVCKALACNCPKWHGLSAPGEPSPLLEVWQRQFCDQSYRTVAPAAAALFNVNIRIPAALMCDMLASSGAHGVYFEPRGAHIGEVSKEYQVVWLPRLSFAEVLVQKQQHEEALGIARVGERYGLRSHVTNAKILHSKLRPEVPYLPRAEIRSFQVGPLPFGTQRQALTLMLDALPWATKPLHPIPGQRESGVWWRVQATTAPPMTVVPTKHGEVLIVEQSEKEQEVRHAPAVVASRQTIRQLQHSGQAKVAVGPNPEAPDPWMQFLQARGRAPCPPEGSRGGQMPGASSQQTVPSEEAVAKKVEARVAASIASQVREQVNQAMQVSQASNLDKFDRIEKQVDALHTRVDSQESSLQKMMREMMEAQTLRLEELVAPKRRKDGASHE